MIRESPQPPEMKGHFLFFVGAPAIGFLLLAIIILYGFFNQFEFFNPISGSILGKKFEVNFYQIIIMLWFFTVDGSHLFHTLARIFFIPTIFRRHFRAILFSCLFFIVGPLLVIWPSLMTAAFLLDRDGLAYRAVELIPMILLIFYFTWAYWHVTQQHWGFVSIRARMKGRSPSKELRKFYLLTTPIPPLVFFLLDGQVMLTGRQELSMKPLLNFFGLQIFHVVALGAVFFAIFCAIISRQIVKRRNALGTKSEPHERFETFFLASTCALHLAVMSCGPLAFFVHPVITIGHDCQYHLLCYIDGKKRIQNLSRTISFREKFFYALHSNAGVLAIVAIFFAFASSSPFLFSNFVRNFLDLLPFPLIETPKVAVALSATRSIIAPSIEMQFINYFCIAFAAQHYYLDGKIWKLSRDREAGEGLVQALTPVEKTA